MLDYYLSLYICEKGLSREDDGFESLTVHQLLKLNDYEEIENDSMHQPVELHHLHRHQDAIPGHTR